MDPLDFFSFNHQYAEVNGKRYHYVDQHPEGEQSPITLLLIHGFPDLWYGWRHQIGPWVRAGYRVIAPDCVGYGQTAKPTTIESYTPKSVTEDLLALLDHLAIPKVVVVAHDWGAAISWRFCAWAGPERVLGLVAASLPYNPPAKIYLPQEEVTARVPDLGYMEYFVSEASTSEIEARLFRFYNLLFRRPSAATHAWSRKGALRELLYAPGATFRTDLAGPEELEVHLRSFSRTWGEEGSGMQGPLNYYRTGKLRVEQEKDLPASLPESLPILFFHPLQDSSCVPSQVERMKRKFLPQTRIVTLDCGHWVMLEKPDEVTNTVLTWLSETGLGPRRSNAKL